MFDGLTTAVDATGVAALPGWAAAVAAALVLLVVGTLASIRDGKSWPLMQAAVGVVLLLMGWLGLDQLARRDLAAERRALDQRAFELSARALAPGSALACLDAMAGGVVEESCEKALFASPEATAAAVAYVAAQLSLLAANSEYARRGGASPALATLRRVLEADRFGIAAHVLATRDGCTPTQCRAFFLLLDASRISANLAKRPFESYVQAHMSGWQNDGRPGASGTAAGAPVAGAKLPNSSYFPSAASIPPVNIMTAEPAAQQAQTQDKPPGRLQDKPHDTIGEASASSRKPGAQQTPQQPSTGSAPARSAPMQLGPNVQ